MRVRGKVSAGLRAEGKRNERKQAGRRAIERQNRTSRTGMQNESRKKGRVQRKSDDVDEFPSQRLRQVACKITGTQYVALFLWLHSTISLALGFASIFGMENLGSPLRRNAPTLSCKLMLSD